MKLRNVRIENFRCFDSLSVELDPDLTVFVGVNGAGKTAVLDAIGIVLGQVVQRLSAAEQRLHAPGIKDTDFRVLLDGQTDLGAPGIAGYARVAAETLDQVSWDCWRPSGRRRESPSQKLGLSDLNRYLAPLQGNGPETAARYSLPVFAYYGTDRATLNIPGRLHRSKTDFSRRTAALVGALDVAVNFKECLQWLDWAEADELRALRDRQDAEFGQSDALHAARRAIRTVFQETVENPRFEAGHKLVVDTRLPSGKRGKLRVDQLSQGYRAVLAMAIDFARRQALANPCYQDPSHGAAWLRVAPEPEPWKAPSIMLIDEVDLHLHPEWQQRIINDLRRAFPNTQLIVTTHSPQVLTTVDKKCIRRAVQRDGRWDFETPDFQPCGVESGDALTSIMGVDPLPDINETRCIAEYRALIEDGKPESDEARDLRAKLEKHFGSKHPVLLDCDRLIRFEEFAQRARDEEGE